MNNNKDKKPEISIDLIKDIVKKYKKNGFQGLTLHDLAISVTTIGFKDVCKQFGGQWNDKIQKQAMIKLNKSDYELQWYGKINNQNYLPFLQLCLRGDIQKVKEFLFNFGKAAKSQLITTTDNFKRTALHLAVKEGFDVLAQYLITEGFSVNARDRELKTPLHYCKNQLICSMLLKRGANALAKDNKNCTSAHYAASGSQYKVLELLLKKSNVVNEVDSTQKTPLFYAIYNNSEEQVNICRILIQNGAKINEKDIYGKTVLHYAAQLGKARCIPFLLQKGANIEMVDDHNKTAIELASTDKIKKIITAYWESKGHVFDKQEKQKRSEFSKIVNESKLKQNTNKNKKESAKDGETTIKNSAGQAYTKQVNQVSTWIRQKFFVLMKKLQQSGIKSLWHLKRPYIYTGSWAEDVQGLQDLYETFLNVNGPEAAMRTFNILCPYQKALPNVLGKSQQAFQSFFGQNWFSNDPIQKVRNMHSQTKIRNQLQLKIKQAQDLKNELIGYKSQIQKLEVNMMNMKQDLKHYEKIQQDLRKERTKNTQQYSQILRHLSEISSLKEQITKLSSGQDQTDTLVKMVDELKSKNQDLIKQIQDIKVNEAAARRKCGQIFLKSLSLAKSGQSVVTESQQSNLYDDDAIINLYDLLKDNPPNLQKRFKLADKRGAGKLNIEQFTKLLQNLAMLPQDVMSMHRISGFSQGRKTLSNQQFKTILQNRHKNRPMWQKKLVRKIKTIILSQNTSIQKLFKLIDTDNSGTIQNSQLRKGLQNFNIFMNQTDWSNLFNLLDADKSGTVELQQLKNLLQLQTTGKLDQISSQIRNDQKQNEQQQQKGNKQQKQEQKNEQQQDQQNKQQQKPQNKQQQQQQQQQQNNNSKNEQNNLNQQDNNNEQQNNQQQQNEQKSENKLLSQQQQPQYQQQQSQEGMIILNGQIKVQIPKLLFQNKEIKQAYINLVINQLSEIKKANLNLQKLSIVAIFQLIQYKIFSYADIKIVLAIYTSREFSEDTYLGQVSINLQDIFDNPNKWQINQAYPLEASQYQKQVAQGQIAVQIRWIPKVQE